MGTKQPTLPPTDKTAVPSAPPPPAPYGTATNRNVQKAREAELQMSQLRVLDLEGCVDLLTEQSKRWEDVASKRGANIAELEKNVEYWNHMHALLGRIANAGNSLEVQDLMEEADTLLSRIESASR